MELDDDDRRQLTDLSYRYASFVDARRFDDMADLFALDAVLVTPLGRRKGRDAILDAMRTLVRYDRTFHLVGQVRHWVEGEAVKGETYCVAHHFVPEAEVVRDRVMYIRYHDDFVLDDGRWRISRRQLDVAWSGQEDKAVPPS